jgi:hypothetical protein
MNLPIYRAANRTNHALARRSLSSFGVCFGIFRHQQFWIVPQDEMT